MSALMQDLRFACRLLLKSPGFALMATIIMALGIGANTAIFSIVHAVPLEPLPFHDVDRLVQVWHTPPQTSFPGMTRFSTPPSSWFRRGPPARPASYGSGPTSSTEVGTGVITGSRSGPACSTLGPPEPTLRRRKA